jgi:hypothetical protein
LTEDLCQELQRRDVQGRNIAIKVRLDDWTTVTRARTVGARTNDAEVVLPVVLDLFRAYAPARPVRLLGVRLAAFEAPPAAAAETGDGQLVLPLPEALLVRERPVAPARVGPPRHTGDPTELIETALDTLADPFARRRDRRP